MAQWISLGKQIIFYPRVTSFFCKSTATRETGKINNDAVSHTYRWRIDWTNFLEEIAINHDSTHSRSSRSRAFDRIFIRLISCHHAAINAAVQGSFPSLSLTRGCHSFAATITPPDRCCIARGKKAALNRERETERERERRDPGPPARNHNDAACCHRACTQYTRVYTWV